MEKRNKRIFVAMSGGVDSSVAALLLKEQGHDVSGVFMRCYNLDGCYMRDSKDARQVAAKLGIPFSVWDFEEEYKRRVVDYMVDGYRRGITPNPDVMCNREIKFGLFLERALKEGADYVATGHYVRLRRTRIKNKELRIKDRSPLFVIHNSLFTACDANKDQSYFLWTLTQDKLRHCLFPIGGYLKSEVREIARKAGLSTAEKKDSQGICFLGQVNLGDFLQKYIKPKVGQVVLARADGSRVVVGRHDGAQFYTIGQRHIGIKGQGSRRHQGFGGQARVKGAHETKPVYVAEKDVKTNTLIVAEGSDSPALCRKEVELTDVNFIDEKNYSLIRTNKRIRILARVRYRQPLVPASIMGHGSGVKIIFDQPVKFVAPGQSAVFYERSPSTSSGLKMLGGGVIV